MRVLLTGSTGFIGQNLQIHLRNRGWDIETVGRKDSGSDIDRKMQSFRPEIVIHLATLFIAEHKPEDISNLVQSNITFGSQVVDSMLRHNVHKLINTGTLWQYFQGDRQVPANFYAATKTAFEAILRFYTSAKSLQVMNLMLSDTYGPKDLRGKLLSKLISIAGTDEVLQLSPGEQKIEWTYIDDIVAAFEAASLRMIEGTEKEALSYYSVTSGETHSLQATVKICEEVLKKKIRVQFGAKPYRAREVMRPEKLDPQLPGWAPKISFRQGIEACVHE